MARIVRTKRIGMESFNVELNGKVIAYFHSEAGARTFILTLINKSK